MIKSITILDEMFYNDEKMDALSKQLAETNSFAVGVAELMVVVTHDNIRDLSLATMISLTIREINSTIELVQKMLSTGDYIITVVETLLDMTNIKIHLVNKTFKDHPHLYPEGAGSMLSSILIYPLAINDIDELDRELHALKYKITTMIKEGEKQLTIDEDKEVVMSEALQALLSSVVGVQNILKAKDRRSLMPSFMVRSINNKIDALNAAHNK